LGRNAQLVDEHVRVRGDARDRAANVSLKIKFVIVLKILRNIMTRFRSC
jgi:hypothetical protein